MYSIIPRSPVAIIVIGMIAIAITIIAFLNGSAPVNGNASLRGFFFAALASVTPTMLVLYLGFGLTSRWAPWRFLWKLLPGLNEAVFPDLNGMWIGEVRSNFPVKVRMAQGAWRDENFDLPELEKAELRTVRIAMQIKASFFSVSFKTAVDGGKDGDSESIVVKLAKHNGFGMHYIYKQKTAEPAFTDESSHPGSASVEIKYSPSAVTMDGLYWNLRRWRQGLNLAGRISLRKVSADHTDPKALLAQTANQQTN